MNEFQRLAQIAPKPSLTQEFREFAEYFYRNWYIETIDSSFEIYEAEFLLQTNSDIHKDPNIDNSIHQRQMANWYIPDGGIDITFGCEEYGAAIFIRSLKNRKTGEMIIGPSRCFTALFQNIGNVLNPNPVPHLIKKDVPEVVELRNVPRVQLSVEERSANREQRLKYLFRPYRFIRTDMQDFPEKYLAMLYTDKIAQQEIDMKIEESIYNKYLDAYDKGYYAISIDSVWKISSRSHRIAGLLGYLNRHQPSDLI